MNTYIPRSAEKEILRLTHQYPAVVITGPRQVGKTSLVKHLAGKLPHKGVYLDLELPEDFNKLNNPALFLERLQDQTVIIDEVQRLPELFPVLRALIDRKRQPGRFILLGSASPELIRDTSESLAGRVAYLELPPFTLAEIPSGVDFMEHWLRGGFPESLLSDNDQKSLEWRFNFIQSYLERDLPLLGLGADPMLIRRLWTMIAHMNGNVLNMQTLAKSLGISGQTVRRYLDFLESAFLIRRLQPYHFNIKKRLVKSPKIYIRDTGILHALLNIGGTQQLLGHPVVGGSWEAYVLQEVYARLLQRTELFFYRTQDGTEVDLVIAPGGIPASVVEIKFSTTPKVNKGFRIAKDDLQTEKSFIICPVEEGYPIAEDIEVLGIHELDKLF
ncbi:MAG: ATP-binding protein [Phaeodactylibacter sp.]|nr:ATP-binding protein [Phaeodactylibacter sp.]